MPSPEPSARPPTLPSERSRASDRLCELVLAAAGLDPGDREELLHERAGNDPELLAEARRRLVLAEEVPDGFLSAPAADSDNGGGAEDADELPALLAGWQRYEVGEILGSGGNSRSSQPAAGAVD